MSKRSRDRRKAGPSGTGESPWALSSDGVMTVPPWEFFPRVFPAAIFGEGHKDSAKLRSVAGAFSWAVRSWDGESTRLANMLEIGREAGRDAGDEVSVAVASFLVAADLGMMEWDGGAVVLSIPAEVNQQTASSD